MRRVVPVREPCPSLPEPTKPKKRTEPFGREEVFAFDTETTRCGKKLFKSIQFSWYEGGNLRNHVIFERGRS